MGVLLAQPEVLGGRLFVPLRLIAMRRSSVLVSLPEAVTGQQRRLLVRRGCAAMGLRCVEMPAGGIAVCLFSSLKRLSGTPAGDRYGFGGGRNTAGELCLPASQLIDTVAGKLGTRWRRAFRMFGHDHSLPPMLAVLCNHDTSARGGATGSPTRLAA
ncbi:MAG: hypothetical protein M3Y83_00350 [Actinomycetota bacterium]|nr:hypothetical protein [Actinomycetota bacterium]